MKKQSILRLIATFMVAVMMLTMLASCVGKDDNTPTITISEDGYWVINGEKTNVKATPEEIIDENPQGLAFSLQDDGTYLVSCGNAKYLSNIVIPSTYKGGAVVGIEDYAFYHHESLTCITIPNSVTSIGKYAFFDCVSLTSITIPNSVTSIGEHAFSSCTSLTSVIIPDSVTSIGAGAFSYCSSLASITIPDSVTSIGAGAFLKCYSLTSVVIPDSVTSIGDHAFYSCTSLTNVVIPDSVTSIGYEAFSSCEGLTSVTIGNGVTNIGHSAFSECLGLERIYFNAASMNNEQYGSELFLFYNAGANGNGIKVTIGKDVTKIPEYLFDSQMYQSRKITSVEFEEGSVCERIGYGAFYYCHNLVSIRLPDSLTRIDGGVFHFCSNLVSIHFDGTIEQWNAISKGSYWNSQVPATEVVCSDGTVTL